MLEGSKVEPLGIAKLFSQEREQMEKTGITTYDISKIPDYKFSLIIINSNLKHKFNVSALKYRKKMGQTGYKVIFSKLKHLEEEHNT